jgi:hypothetical protein
MKKIEEAIANFMHCYSEAGRDLPPIDRPRALLKARLSQLAAESPPSVGERLRELVVQRRRWVLISAGLLVVVGISVLQFKISPVNAMSTPDTELTPGLARAVTVQEICSAETAATLHALSPAVVYEVFEQYGIRNPKPRAYEIDYLITPSLGGANDIRNLWPQPYSTGTWNSRIKDALEDHLYTLVCQGKLDLATAQRDISTDWIAAYKKYFQTDRPLPNHATFYKDPPWE